MSNTSKIILVTIIAGCILLGLGYAAIQNITLNIAGTAIANADQTSFKVKFVGTPAVSNGENISASIIDDTNATIGVTGLTEAGQYITATYEVKNESGDLSADLKVATTNDNPEYFKISSLLAKTSLTAGETTTVLVTVELNKTPITASESANIGVELTAMPVQPGEEGTSDVNDYSETPIEMNEYGFYYNEAYEITIDGVEYSYVFYEDTSVAKYSDGFLTDYHEPETVVFEEKKIVFPDDFEFTISSDGKSMIDSDGNKVVLDPTFEDNYKRLYGNHSMYGFYFEEGYSYIDENGVVKSFVMHDGGAVELYSDYVLEASYPEGTIGYSMYLINMYDIFGEEETLFSSSKNGRVLDIESKIYYGLDPTFWSKVK